MDEFPDDYRVERVKKDDVWYLIVYAPDGSIYFEIIDPNQND